MQLVATPYFCFRYLYDTPEYDSADDWTDYIEIKQYLLKRNYNMEDIEKAKIKALDDREIDDREIDDREIDDREIDDREIDDREIDDRELDDRELDDREIENSN